MGTQQRRRIVLLLFLLLCVLACQVTLEKVGPSTLHFTQPLYHVTVYENSAPKTYVQTEVKMGVYLTDPQWSIKYKIVSGDNLGFFKTEEHVVGDFCFVRLRTKSGTTALFNREVQDNFMLTLQASEKTFDYEAWTQVMIHILDINDLKPLFSPPSYKTTVWEDAPLKTVIATVSATDADLGQNAQFYYTFHPRSSLFTVHPTSGVVMLSGKLNATLQKKHDLRVQAVDRMSKISGGETSGNLATLLVQVEEAKKKPPRIASVDVMESDQSETSFFATIMVDDNDSESKVDSIDIVAGDPDKYFKVIQSFAGSNTFRVVSTKVVNWLQNTGGFNLSLRARDKSIPPLYSQLKIINLEPSKYTSLKFDEDVYMVKHNECAPPGSQVAVVKVTRPFPNLIYVLKPSQESSYFQINPKTGLIITRRQMDVIDKSRFKLDVTAANTLASTSVVVDLIDCNNHPPVFSQSLYQGTFNENLPVGTSVFQVHATDDDQGDNGFVTYSLVNERYLPFTIEKTSGIISTSKMLDYELTQRLYRLHVWASDSGLPFRRQAEVYVSLMLNNLNDNNPAFEQVNCNGTVPRDLPIGKQVAILSAVDMDDLQPLKYEIVSGNDLQIFEIGPTTGILSLKKPLQVINDFQPSFYSLQITATDGQNYALPTVVNISVTNHKLPVSVLCQETGVLQKLTQAVFDSIQSQDQHQDEDTSLNIHLINNYAPHFHESLPSSIDVEEDLPVNSIIIHLVATDLDSGFNGKLVYVITSGNDDSCFSIDTETGILKVLLPLDRELSNVYNLNISVYDLGMPQKSSWSLLVVNLLDVNDNTPRFPPAGYHTTIPEDIKVGTPVIQVKAEDSDTEDRGMVKYSLLTWRDKFNIDDVTGFVTVAHPLDRESSSQYVLKIEARDQPKDGHQLVSITELVVIVEDVNDNSPNCMPARTKAKVPEDLPKGTVLLFLEAFDPDDGPAGEVTYTLTSSDQGTFRIEKQTGALILEKELDFETRSSYNLTVLTRDGGQPSSRTSRCAVEVEVLDVNENLHAPSFPSFVFEGGVPEGAPVGTSVMMVTAQDKDKGKDGKIKYAIWDGTDLATFSIEEDTGIIRTAAPLDRETVSRYWLSISAMDSGSIPLSSIGQVYIQVSDINDNPPQLSRPVFYASVPENSPPNVSILRLEAWDADAGSEGRLSFSILNGNAQGFFAINPETGWISTTAQLLDREFKAEHNLEVAVSDNGDPLLQSTSRVIIEVLDANDNAPTFLQKRFNIQLPERAGSEDPANIYRLVASDQDEGSNAQVTYSLQDDVEKRFSIHPAYGHVFSRSTFRAGEYYILTVRATDGGTPPRSTTVRLHVQWIPIPAPSTQPLAFDEPHFNFAVMETDPVNHMVGVISTEISSSQLWFEITGGDNDMDFDIDKSTGGVLIARTLDGKKRSNYNLTVQVTDGNSAIRTQAYVRVIDINQHRPQFQESSYEVRIPEDAPTGAEILRLSATDLDSGTRLVYTLQGSTDPGSIKLFQLDPASGALTTTAPLDYEKARSHTLSVMVRDQEVPIKRDFVRVVVEVEDCNDHPPQFLSPQYEKEVLILTPKGTSVMQVRALDKDQGMNGELRYSIQAGNLEGFFNMNPVSGIISFAKTLEQPKQERYVLTIQAADQGVPQLRDTSTVLLHIKLSDSTPPRFSAVEYFLEVKETIAVGTPIFLVSATSSSAVSYEIRSGNKDSAFAINPFSGVISAQKNLDFETLPSYQLKIRAANMVGAVADALVLLYLIDENDNAPGFSEPSYAGQISEAARINSIIMDETNKPLVIRATDADRGSNSLLVYEIVEPAMREYFKIDPSMGTLMVASKLDYELSPVFHFNVQVHDSGTPMLSASRPAKVTIYLLDVNDSPPVFLQESYEVTIWLPAHNGMDVLTVQATDRDSEVTYSIMEGNLDSAFFIHPQTGLISLLNSTNLGRHHKLTVRASDGLFKSASLVKINFAEAFETDLKFDQEVYTAVVMENNFSIETLIILGVSGNQLNEPLFFSVLNNGDHFQIIRSSGVLRTRGVTFDREEREIYEVAVEVKDNRNPPRVAQSEVKIYIKDVNDNHPEFVNLPYQTSVHESAEPGDVLLRVSATDQDFGENGAITYSLAEDYKYFGIDPFLGDIAIKRNLDYQALNKYILKVIAKDRGTPPLQTEEQVLVVVRNKSNPIFQRLFYMVKVPENIISNTPILHIQAHSPEGLRLIYTLVGKDALKLFNIDFKTGVLSVIGNLDFETKTKHVLTVRATDTAVGSSSEAVVEVQVEDINDNPPVFSQRVYMAVVSEGLPSNTPVLCVSALDADSGKNNVLSYQIIANGLDSSIKFFHIDSDTGEIATTQELDYETQKQFLLRVQARDHGMRGLSGETLVIVNVSDVNDNSPEFRQPHYEAVVNELATCGHIVIKVQALDPDSGGVTKLEYLILSGNEHRHFAINSTSGVISMANLCKKPMDPFYTLRISASDGVHRTAVPVYINITRANKYSPAFQQNIFEVELAENAEEGTTVIEVLAVDPDDGPYGSIEYTIINKLAHDRFSIDQRGRIATLQKLDRENPVEKVIAIKVMARDGGGKVAFCTVKIILTDENDNPPQFKASKYTLTIQSNVSKGSPIVQVIAYDADEGLNADVTYYVDELEDATEELIEIHQSTGVICIKESLVGLENKVFNFKVKAQDGGHPHWDSSVPVHLQVVPREVSLPRFSEPLYTFAASEDLPPGAEVGSVKALAVEPIIYSLVKGTTMESNKDGVFTLDRQTGALKVDKNVDHETTKWYQIDVMAHCLHFETDLVSLASVSIQVKDVNDNQPIFEANPYKAFLMENMPAGTTVIQVTANDQDTGSNGEVTYRLNSSLDDSQGLFAIDGESGWITTLKELDCEIQRVHKFHVVASDHGRKVQLSSQTLVEVIVTDDNDNPPRFTLETYKGSVTENGQPGEVITALRTTDADISEHNRRITCYITEGDPLGQFSIDLVGEEWKISSKMPLDREALESYLLKVTASDGKFQVTADVEVSVLDINDNGPECQQMLYTVTVPEDAPSGRSLLHISANDPDVGSNAQIMYTLEGTGADTFRLDPHTGELSALSPLDREKMARYRLVAKATDGGGRSCQADVYLTVEDVNDNAPIFLASHYAVAVFDNTTLGTPIAVVFAKDPDEGINAEVFYSLTTSANGHFSIEETTGVIHLEKPLEDIPLSTVELTACATDKGAPNPLSSFTSISISIVDLGTYRPVFCCPEYVVAVLENADVGSEVLNVANLMRDGVEKAEIQYEILSGNEQMKFRLDSKTGILNLNNSLDFEVRHQHSLSVEGTRGNGVSLSDVIVVVINVTDINDCRPRFAQESYSVGISEDAAIGDVVLSVSADDQDGPSNNQITYSIVGGDPHGHFMVQPDSGEIRAAKHLDREEIPSYSLTVRASDGGQPALFSDIAVSVRVLDINDNPPTFFQLNYSLMLQEDCPVGTSVLELIMTDRDSPENGPPYRFKIMAGNEGHAFQVDPNGLLTTSSTLKRKLKEKYLLQIQVFDSGIPPLSSFAFVNIQVTEPSRYAPSALPLEIYITTNERVFRGGVLGKIHATDRDPHDVLVYSLGSNQPQQGVISVGSGDGKIIASEGLPQGQYNLTVTISDGTFATLANVQVHVWCFGQDALDRALLLRFGHVSPEEFIGDHWRSLQRFLANILAVARQQIHMASLQQVEGMHAVDLLLVAGGDTGRSFLDPHLLAEKISASVRELEQAVGLRIKKVAHLPCKGLDCARRTCKENVQLDPFTLSTYSNARLSVITPRHSLDQICTCNDTGMRFNGHSFVRYHPPPRSGEWTIRFQLKTHQSHAVLIVANGTNAGILQLVNGIPNFRFRCQDNSSEEVPYLPVVSDGAWHLIVLQVDHSSFRLLVDGSGSVTSHRLLEPCEPPPSEEELILGGRLHHQPKRVSQAFRGCLNAISIDGKDIALGGKEKTGSIVEEVGIKPCCAHDGACVSDPCQHGGICAEIQGGGYSCICTPPFTGQHCQLEGDPCAAQPCLHGGTCTTTLTGYACRCLSQHQGQRCEEDILGCPETPCLHGGHCERSIGDVPPHCNCTEGYAGPSCEVWVMTPQNRSITMVTGPREIAEIVAGVLGLIILVGALVLGKKHLSRRKKKTHKPVSTEDPDVILKNELSKSIGMDTQGAGPEIELNLLRTGSQNNLDAACSRKQPENPEFSTFGPANTQKVRGTVVCSVAPNLPPAPPSSSDNESIVKSTWEGEDYVHPAETTYWPPSYIPPALHEYQRYEITHRPLPPPPLPPLPRDSEHVDLYGGFPFPLDHTNKRAPLPSLFSNKNLDDLMVPRPQDPPPSQCQNEYTAISYYPLPLIEGDQYQLNPSHKRVSMRLSVAQPSYADVEGPAQTIRALSLVVPNYEDSDMVESDYGSSEEVMF
ncbi:protocadherin Fat 2 [Ambystoma mexicanum]